MTGEADPIKKDPHEMPFMLSGTKARLFFSPLLRAPPPPIPVACPAAAAAQGLSQHSLSSGLLQSSALGHDQPTASPSDIHPSFPARLPAPLR